MGKKRILFAISVLAGGGAEKGLINLINALDTKKYDVSVFVIYNDLKRVKEIKNKVSITLFEKKTNLIAGKKCKIDAINDFCLSFEGSILRKLLNLGQHDVEFLFMDSPIIKVISAANEKTIKIARMSIDYSKVISIFIGKESQYYFQKHVRCYKNMNYIVAPAQYSLKAFAEVTRVSSNVRCIYNINKKEEMEPLSLQPVWDVQKNTFTLCTLGRLHDQKGYSRLLKVCQRLNHEKFDYELWILGEGPERINLEKQIADYELHNVRLLGYKDNPYPYLRLCDLYVCSSYSEGLSNAAKEAMLLGKPAVVTDCSGMTELYGNNNEYSIITDNSEDGLYFGIKKMLSNPILYRYYQKQILLRQAYFNPDKSLAQFESMFYS